MWKKIGEKNIQIEVAEELARTFYRVAPDFEDMILLEVGGHLCHVLDIGAGGLSCTSSALEVGRRYTMRLLLTEHAPAIEGYLDIRSEDAHIFRCSFVDLDDSNAEIIHQYVLSRQKQAIKALRGNQK